MNRPTALSHPVRLRLRATRLPVRVARPARQLPGTRHGTVRHDSPDRDLPVVFAKLLVFVGILASSSSWLEQAHEAPATLSPKAMVQPAAPATTGVQPPERKEQR